MYAVPAPDLALGVSSSVPARGALRKSHAERYARCVVAVVGWIEDVLSSGGRRELDNWALDGLI